MSNYGKAEHLREGELMNRIEQLERQLATETEERQKYQNDHYRLAEEYDALKRQLAECQKELKDALAFNVDLHGQGIDLRKRLTEVVAALRQMVQTSSHDHSCQFKACSCGAVKEQAITLGNVNKLLREAALAKGRP